jgi:hypothetical protein
VVVKKFKVNYTVFFNAESAEDAENGKDRGTAAAFVVTQSVLCDLCGLCVEMTL